LTNTNLYPLRFEPIYQYRLWGGRNFESLLRAPLPGNGPIGEAWVLSDRDDHASQVASGPLKGWTLNRLREQFPEQLLGKAASHFKRFPLLLKFLDAREMLSVQVHPSGPAGKTEAWVVLEAGPKSRIYSGLKPGTTKEDILEALKSGTVASHLKCFTPEPGDAFFTPAGTVHTLGGGVVVFEVQQNSDVTFRLYDWDHVDGTTGKPRPLQVDQALACINFGESNAGLVTPVVDGEREELFNCDQFRLWRWKGHSPFTVGINGSARVLVGLEGKGEILHQEQSYEVRKGDVLLLPAVIGTCTFRPDGPVTLLEIALPEIKS